MEKFEIKTGLKFKVDSSFFTVVRNAGNDTWEVECSVIASNFYFKGGGKRVFRIMTADEIEAAYRDWQAREADFGFKGKGKLKIPRSKKRCISTVEMFKRAYLATRGASAIARQERRLA